MEINIGLYKVSQRTPYSKFQLYDIKTGENITLGNEVILEKILSDYNEQKANPEKYFKIQNDSLRTFYDKYVNDISYVFVPEGIKSIGKSAFAGLGMIGVSLPDTIETIEEFAFCECEGLLRIDMPDSVSIVGKNLFKGCLNLEYIKLSSSLKQLPDGMFLDCSVLNDVVVPDSVHTIGFSTFNGCEALTNIKLSKNLTEINAGAFRECFELKEITLPDTLKGIGPEVFKRCAKLKNISIPDNVPNLWRETFAECESLESIKLPKNIELLDTEMFRDCISLKDVFLPDNIGYFQYDVFRNTPSLETINIPKNFSLVPDAPFKESGVKELVINYDIVEIDPPESAMLSMIMSGADHPTNYGIAAESKIDTITIKNNVKTISPVLLGRSGKQITKINYFGTKEEFEKFKENNKEFFLRLQNVKDINFTEDIEKTVER